jgi:hypothetical protein
MGSQTVIVIFIASIAVLMATAFLVVWWRDSKNADEVAADRHAFAITQWSQWLVTMGAPALAPQRTVLGNLAAPRPDTL